MSLLSAKKSSFSASHCISRMHHCLSNLKTKYTEWELCRVQIEARFNFFDFICTLYSSSLVFSLLYCESWNGCNMTTEHKKIKFSAWRACLSFKGLAPKLLSFIHVLGAFQKTGCMIRVMKICRVAARFQYIPQWAH